MNSSMKPFGEKYGVLVAFIIAVFVIIFVGLMGALLALQWRWLIIIVVMVVFLLYVGRVITTSEGEDVSDDGQKKTTPGRFDGILIDARNRISLSRFQIVMWTVLALSAWSTLVLHRTVPFLADNVRDLRVLVVDRLEEGEENEVKSVVTDILKDYLKENNIEDLEDTKINSLFTVLTGVEELPESIESIPDYEPLNVSFPQELLLAMGISTASLAGATIIKSNKAGTPSERSLELYNSKLNNAEKTRDETKKKQERIEGEISEIARQKDEEHDSNLRKDLEDRLAVSKKQYDLTLKSATDAQKRYEDLATAGEDRAGILQVNRDIADAKWSDMLSGEKIYDFQLLDIAKIQMFFFTIIIVFSYAALIWAQMSTMGAEILLWILPTVSLPVFSSSLVMLLGLSHAGYLSLKSTG